MNKEITIGEKIKKIRKSFGLTQEQLAEKADMDYKYLSKIENGLHLPNYSTIKKISNALNVNIDLSENLQNSNCINSNPYYIKSLKILNSAQNEEEIKHYFKVLKITKEGFSINK